MDSIAQLNGSLTGRYAVEREIGRGGMATVYLARDLRHDRRVAVKVLNPDLGAVLGAERFLSEIKVTAHLQHPHLLPLFDSGEADGLLFYVMPFVDGESLRARLVREKQLPIDDAVGISTAAASALEYAHQHGVIHRDLKPENILLQGGQAVVADFGIALAVSTAGGSRVTQTGISLGTPQYMSPEQATGDRTIDRRSDIYSLAAVTYEMLTGEPPHTGSTMQAIIARVLTERPRSVRAGRPSVPEHVERALERGLEKIPADRWPSAHEFSEALQGRISASAATRSAPVARAAASSDRWRELGRRVTLPLLTAVSVASLAFGAWQWRRAHSAEPGPTVRFMLALPRGVRLWNSATPEAKLAISADGQVVGFVGMGDDGVSRIYLRPLSDTRAQAVPGTEGAASVFFSPDRRWIGMWIAGNLVKVPVEGGTTLTLTSAPGTFLGASWLSNHQIVYSSNGIARQGVTPFGRILVVPDGGGTPRLLTRLDSAHRDLGERHPVVLDDERTVIYGTWPSTNPASARIAVASLSTGEYRISDVAGIAPIGMIDRFLVYATPSGTLMAVPFDLARARATGNPVALQPDVAVNVLSGAAQVAIARSGSIVYRLGSRASQLVLVDARGAERAVPAEARAYSYPRFSPDGRRVAVGIIASDRQDVWLLDLASNTPTRLTTGGNTNERPEWSPDGKRVLFRSDQSGRSSLWWRPADLSAPDAPLLDIPRVQIFEGVLSPDARYIAYQVDTGGADLYYRALAGDTVAKPIAVAPQFTEVMPRISPNGKWIAFVTDESGARQVVVQPFPGPGARTQISTNGGDEPVWSRDGAKIYYRGDGRFLAARVRADPTFAVVGRESLFEDRYLESTLPHANYDVARDGVHLLVLKAANEPDLEVVYDWRAEVLARMSAAVAVK